VDNCIFASAGKHLARCQPCAPSPAPVVARAGTKAAHRTFLWISPRLCQNYPQFYAPGAWAARSSIKTTRSATAVCLFCSLIDSIEADVTLRFRCCRGLGGASEAVRTCPDDGRCSAQDLGTAHPSYQAAKPFRAVNDRLWVPKRT